MTKQPISPVVLHVRYAATEEMSSSSDQQKPYQMVLADPKPSAFLC